jgi:hypothetical protein
MSLSATQSMASMASSDVSKLIEEHRDFITRNASQQHTWLATTVIRHEKLQENFNKIRLRTAPGHGMREHSSRPCSALLTQLLAGTSMQRTWRGERSSTTRKSVPSASTCWATDQM